MKKQMDRAVEFTFTCFCFAGGVLGIYKIGCWLSEFYKYIFK